MRRGRLDRLTAAQCGLAGDRLRRTRSPAPGEDDGGAHGDGHDGAGAEPDAEPVVESPRHQELASEQVRAEAEPAFFISDFKDIDGNYLTMCHARQPADNGLRLGAVGDFISSTVLRPARRAYADE